MKQSTTYKRLVGPNLFNWRLFWWSYLLLFIPQILFDVVAFDSASWLWLPIWTTGHIVATAVVIVAKVLGFDRLQAKRPSAAANLILASVAGAVRVVWIGELSFLANLTEEFDLQARILAGVILGSLVFVALTNILETDKGYHTAKRTLVTTQNKLNQLKKAVRKEVTKTHFELAEDTRQIVEPRLEEIARLLNGQSLGSRLRKSITRNLKDILENQVKPLNNNLRALGRSLDNPSLVMGVSRARLFRVPSGVQADLAISPLWILILLLGVVPFSLYVFESMRWAPLGVGIAFFSYLLILMVRRYLRRQKLVSFRTAIMQYVALIVQLVVIHYATLLLFGLPESSAPFVALMAFVTLTFTILAVGLEAVQEYNRSEFLTEIERNNQRIEKELRLLNQRVWVEKRRWALTIHGTVQSSLTAALARLRLGEGLSAADLKKIAEHVLQAKNGLRATMPKSFDLKQAIRQQRKAWDGIMKVKVDARGSEFQSLADNLWAGFCANEIIKEGLSNAFRHGSARQVNVTFVSEKAEFVTIVIASDGNGPTKSRRKGLGSQLLDEIAHPWSLTQEPNEWTVLRAQIPVSKTRLARKN